METLFEMTRFSEDESVARFARKLKGMGIEDDLESMGAKRGDEIKIKDYRDEDTKLLGFLTAEDKERELYLHCKIFIYTDNSMSLERFMSGKVGKYEFQCNDWERDTLFFKGRGRGRKPETAERTSGLAYAT